MVFNPGLCLFLKMSQLTPDSNYNVTVTYDDGSQVKIFSSQLRYRGLSNFKDWNCEAGMSRIFVTPDGSVFSGECENDFLGHLHDDSFMLLDQPTTCRKTMCVGNPDDLMTRKSAPNLNLENIQK